MAHFQYSHAFKQGTGMKVGDGVYSRIRIAVNLQIIYQVATEDIMHN